MKLLSNTITEWEKEGLAIQLSQKKTQEGILEQEGSTTPAALLDFTLHKIGTHTKTYQRNLKKGAEQLPKRPKKHLTNKKRDDPATTEEEIKEIEQEVEDVLDTICTQEWKTFFFFFLKDKVHVNHI